MAKILIVDDNRMFRVMLELLLVKDNHEVIVAVDGKDALEKFIKEKPSLIISDIFMDEMDGLELISEIKSHNNEVRIIAMSAGIVGEQSDFHLSTAELIGAHAVLKKPFSSQELKEAISVAMNPKTTKITKNNRGPRP
ncbi:Response regulator receiver domain-containing protein [Gammaproteobacteria bacterium]